VFFWEAPERVQWMRLMKETRELIDVQLSALTGCGESPIDGIMQAWQLDSANLTKDPELGLVQVCCERDWSPEQLWVINDSKWSAKEVSKIARENLEQAKVQTTRRNSRDMALYIMMAIAILIVISTLFVLATNNIDWAGTWAGITKAIGGGK
jgi:hypothetical protein